MSTKSSPISINYVYFGVFFLLLCLMSTSSVLIKEGVLGSRFFFLFYAFGQIVIEISGLIFLGALLERYTKPIYFWLFIGCTFLLGLLHILDFLMDRILDLTAWDTVSFVIDTETFADFFYLLDASGIPLWAWGAMFLGFLALPFLGIFFYKQARLFAEKKPLCVKPEIFLQTFICIPIALAFWDFSASSIIHPDAYRVFVKSLPWKFTFIRPSNVLVQMPHSILAPPPESAMQAAVDQVQAKPALGPNIYLFIIESLREDFITQTVAPHLSAFRKEAIAYDTSVSNANGTHVSWFSIFHSQFPLFWNEYRKKGWSLGSPALQTLKKWGYKIRVYSSAQLGYYGMDELIFGKELSLIDSYQPFHHSFPIQAWESDQKAMETAAQDLAKDPSLARGQLFIFFLDSTHFDYSWPKQEPSRFTPFAKSIAYFRAYQTQKNIELIKNSYRNSIHFVDSLFGSFWQQLPRREEAIVAVMGDHGEEFFEHGHLFHNSHLIDEQIRIPLYMYFGAKPPAFAPRNIVSQMDLFPSLLDYLSGQTFSFLQGESIFRKTNWPYAMICRFNGGRTPYEFSFHNGRNKVILRFQHKHNVFATQPLMIRSLWNCKNQNVSECKLSIDSWLKEEFQEAFDRLFPQQ